MNYKNYALVASMLATLTAPLFGMGRQSRRVQTQQTMRLMHAASDGNIALLTRLLDDGADINTKDENGRTLLHWAVFSRRADVIALLISRNIQIRARTNDGRTARDMAVQQKNSDMIQLLTGYELCTAAGAGDLTVVLGILNGGAHPDTGIPGGLTALHFAAQKGHTAIVELLLARGADHKKQVGSDGKAPLDIALENGHFEAASILQMADTAGMAPQFLAVYKGECAQVKAYLDEGFDIETRGARDWTLLHMAASANQVEVAELLLESKADVHAHDYAGETPRDIALKTKSADMIKLLNAYLLFAAVDKGDMGAVQAYLSDHVDPNGRAFKKTSLHVAAHHGYEAITELLLARGADINARSEQGHTALCYAIRAGRTHIVELLLKRGADVHQADKKQLTPLHFAAARGDEQITRLLIEQGANVQALSKDKKTPRDYAIANGKNAVAELLQSNDREQRQGPSGNQDLIAAIQKRNCNLARTLIFEKADIHAIDAYGKTALHRAAELGLLDLVTLLLNKQANPQAMCVEGLTPLHYAAKHGHVDSVRALILYEANITARDMHGFTPLHYAAQGGHTDIVNTLIERGADVHVLDKHGFTPLFQAAFHGHTATVQLLIEKGAHVNACNKWHYTPLHYAAQGGCESTVALLLQHGANPCAEGDNGLSPFYAINLSKNTANLAQLLIDAGANINKKNNETGQTFLHCAAAAGNMAVVELLVRNGADVNARDNDGETPLHCAQMRKHKRYQLVAAFLVQSGAQQEAPVKKQAAPVKPKGLSEQETKMLDAAFNGDSDTVTKLLRTGVSCAVKDKFGNTALHYAARDGDTSMIATLLYDFNASADTRNNTGHTPYDLAVASDHVEATSILRQFTQL